MDRLIGQQIDHYLIEQHIARGGMADVYLAEDVRLRRKVALKVMLASLTHQRDLIARFQREAEAVARLNHPNIVQIYSAGLTENNQPYLATQYIEGGSLHTWLSRLAQRGQRLDVGDALRLARQVADALEAAHEAGIVHRDIKPSNILLRPDGTPVLTDMGIAAVQSVDTQLTQPDSVLGTPQYMSPEQAMGQRVDGRSDIYSLGIILYQMLAGRVPFSGDSPVAILHQQVYEAPPPLSKVRPGLSPATYQMVATCLQKDPAQRYQTAAALRAALERALAMESGQPAPPEPITRTRSTPVVRRLPHLPGWLLPAGLIGLLLLFALLFGLYRLWQTVTAGEEGEGTATTPAVIGPAPTLDPNLPTMNPDTTPALPPETTVEPLVTTNVTAVRLDNPPVIDGDLADWPSLTPVLSAYRVHSVPEWDGSDDLEAAWRLGWDDTNLYLGVTIRDDIHVQTRTDNQIFRGDSLDVQIDTNRGGGNRLRPTTFQLIFSPGDFGAVPPAVFRFRGSPEGRSTSAPGHSIAFQARRTGDGYVLETAVPWRDLEVTPSPGMVLGLALNATDNDTPGTAVQEVFKSNAPTRTFSDPTTWGTMTLE